MPKELYEITSKKEIYQNLLSGKSLSEIIYLNITEDAQAYAIHPLWPDSDLAVALITTIPLEQATRHRLNAKEIDMLMNDYIFTKADLINNSGGKEESAVTILHKAAIMLPDKNERLNFTLKTPHTKHFRIDKKRKHSRHS